MNKKGNGRKSEKNISENLKYLQKAFRSSDKQLKYILSFLSEVLQSLCPGHLQLHPIQALVQYNVVPPI